MTEKEFYQAMGLLAKETNILKANANKLARLAKKKKLNKSMTLFYKIANDTNYLKALYGKLQTWAYWNKGKLDEKEWALFTKEFDTFFSKLDTIIENINNRNEVIANGNS